MSIPYFSNQEDKTKNLQGKYFTKEKKIQKAIECLMYLWIEVALCPEEKGILEFWNHRIERPLMNPLIHAQLQAESPFYETKSELGFPTRNAEDWLRAKHWICIVTYGDRRRTIFPGKVQVQLLPDLARLWGF